jgi:hypothetical protein
MYSLRPENPIMAIFWNWIPYEFWYMMPVLGIVAVYLALVYAKQIMGLLRKK